MLTEPLTGRRCQKASRDDLVGVDIRRRQNHGAGTKRRQTIHESSSRGSVTRPRTAEAAAVAGLASSVRAPTPCRPSKLRLLVLTEYWPLPTRSPFIPRHIEQPDSRHSAPASRKIRCSPSASAAFLICCEPGTTSICTPLAILRPLSTPAALRRSDNRELVQLPTKTTSIGWSLMGLPAVRPM